MALKSVSAENGVASAGWNIKASEETANLLTSKLKYAIPSENEESNVSQYNDENVYNLSKYNEKLIIKYISK